MSFPIHLATVYVDGLILPRLRGTVSIFVTTRIHLVEVSLSVDSRCDIAIIFGKFIWMIHSCFLMELRHVEGRPNQFIFHIDVAQNWNDCYFVRNTPSSLKWFRSDRTHDNIRILKKERGSTGRMNRITIKDIEYFSFFF